MKWVYKNTSQDKRDHSVEPFLKKLKIETGYFVDVGANDGITGSMTNALENKGWSGILIEPNPLLVKELQKTRLASVVESVVSTAEGNFDFFIVDGPNNLHGLSRISVTQEFEKHVIKHSGTIIKKTAAFKKLSSILLDLQAPPELSFLKVDVEGNELDVFRSLDFSRYSAELIVAEDNTKDLDKSVRLFLSTKGYIVVSRQGMNNFYVKKEFAYLFIADLILVKVMFLKWALKRILWPLFGIDFESRNI